MKKYYAHCDILEFWCYAPANPPRKNFTDPTSGTRVRFLYPSQLLKRVADTALRHKLSATLDRTMKRAYEHDKQLVAEERQLRRKMIGQTTLDELLD